jgi:phage terminase large subunit
MFLKSKSITDHIICDSAEPKSIEELRRMGLNCIPARKGADSIKMGIDQLKRYDIMVTKQSTNLIKELRSYLWETDREGKLTGKPIDHNNHAIDALRYLALNKLLDINNGVYGFR